MRLRLLFALITLLISACGGGTPQPTQELPTLANEEQPTADTMQVLTLEPEGTPVPPPTDRPTFEAELVPGDSRTLVASRTEDPNADVPFSLIRLERTGGGIEATPGPLTIEIRGDGTVTSNGNTRQVTDEILENLNSLIREMNFFGASGDYIGALPLEGSEDFLYTITVERGDLSRSIQARDGNMPQELQNIIAAVLQEGRR
jgi:hypothetical protein